jgi:excisionase family DNA binding protein
MQRKEQENPVLQSKPGSSYTEEVWREFLTIKDIANYLGIKTSTLYLMVEEKRVPHYRIGRLIRFKKSEIDEWMRGQKEPVIDAKTEARRGVASSQGRPSLDVNRIVKKAIDEAGKKGYTSSHGKPDQLKGLGKEGQNGTL